MLSNKPEHLGSEYAARFKDESVAAAYYHRPPYPDELLALLHELIVDTPRVILDAGCGPGNLARPLAPTVDRVDAVDFSAAMVAAGRALPGGDHPHIRWICGPMETAPLDPPYALVTAGSSLHWMDWSVVLPRFRSVLTPRGVLALADLVTDPPPWDAALRELIPRYSTNPARRPHRLLDELAARHLFRLQGDRSTAPVPFRQSVADYIEAVHSGSDFSRDHMVPEQAAALDAEVAALLAPYCPDGFVDLTVRGRVAWGIPGA